MSAADNNSEHHRLTMDPVRLQALASTITMPSTGDIQSMHSETHPLMSITTIQDPFTNTTSLLKDRDSVMSPADLSPALDEKSREPSISDAFCPICNQRLPEPKETYTVPFKKLKPRFVRQIKKLYPNRNIKSSARICIKDLHFVLQKRIDDLLQEDQSQFSKLQEDAMKNMGQFEYQEHTWQVQFEKGRTFGEKAADAVAKFGGSWKFVLSLIGFLAVWMT